LFPDIKFELKVKKKSAEKISSAFTKAAGFQRESAGEGAPQRCSGPFDRTRRREIPLAVPHKPANNAHPGAALTRI